MKRVFVLALCLTAGAAFGQFKAPGAGAPPFQGSTPFQTTPIAPATAPRASNRPEPIDRIVAVVNNDVITQRELADRVAQVTAQLRQQQVAVPPPDVLERQVLERMITDRAQLQFAKQTGVSVDDLTLDRTIQRIAEQNRMTLTEFRRALERDGMSFDRFREVIRGEITMQRLREREVDAKVQVSESEIDNFLEDQKNANTGTGVEYRISHILVRVPDNASPEQIERQRQRAEQALKQLAAGTDFREVAVGFSDAPDALQGGEIGWRASDRLPELFAEALVKMKPGEVSPVLRSPAGFHILKLWETRGAGAATKVEQTHVRHILIRSGEKLSEPEAERKLEVLHQRILQGDDFAEIARLNSDDASASRGGDLGWVLPGDTVPQFEQAMNKLKVGEVSGIVRTSFGFHLIQVLDRRNADVSADRKRVEARRVLRERKIDEAYEEWVRQLRDTAFVEYRLEDK